MEPRGSGVTGDGEPPPQADPAAARRDPLRELRAYPFFRGEEVEPAPSWLARHGPAVALALAYLLAGLLTLAAAVVLAR